MFWEIGEDIRKYVKMTLIPSMRNLFSSLRGLFGIFTVMLLLQLLLSVICIFGIENIKNQQAVLSDFNESLSAVSDSIVDEEGSFMTSDSFKTAMSSTSIFIGALAIWGVCALTVYKKVAFASADRDKYVWGMYVTHGAKRKKIRAMLKCELYVPHFAATVVAYPLALWLCNYTMREHGYGYGHSFINIFAILLISYLCIRLVVAYQCFIIRSMSCTEMLREEDSPKSICYPRKNARLVKGFTPFRYGVTTFMRMRKYYISLALIAAIPAVIWVCFSVSVTGEDSFLSSDVEEFRVNIDAGISEERMKELYNGKLAKLDGISAVSAKAVFDADKMYTHLIADKSYFSTIVNSPYFAATYADNTVKLCISSPAIEQKTGCNLPSVKQGGLAIISPMDSVEYIFSKGERVYVGVSKLSGSVRVVNGNSEELLKRELEDEYEYLELTVTSVSAPKTPNITPDGFSYIDDTYFVMNADDYERVTGLAADGFACVTALEADSYEKILSADGSFSMTLPLSELSVDPKVGDCVKVSGKYSLSARLDGIPFGTSGNTRVVEKDITSRFTYAYISGVSVLGDALRLRLIPCSIITLERGAGAIPSIVVALGTPAFESTDIQVCAADNGGRLTLKNGSVSLDGVSVEIFTSTAVSGAEVGVHMMLSEKNVTDTVDKVHVETLYADNSFKIVCADGMTVSALGLDADPLPADSDKARLILPSSAVNYYSFSKGDKLRIAITLDDVAKYNEDAYLPNGAYDTLATHIGDNQYRYVTLLIDEVIYADVERPIVMMGADNFSRVIDKAAPYVGVDLIIASDMPTDDYARLRSEITEWANSENCVASVTSTGNYLEYLLRKNANYSSIIMLISALVPLLVPFIWYYPMSSLFDRRRSELFVLKAMGKSKWTVRRSFFTEGLFVSLSAFITVLLVSYPAMFVFKSVCTICKLPLEFDYSYLTPFELLTAGAFSALCAALFFILCYATTSGGRAKKPRRKHGNT